MPVQKSGAPRGRPSRFAPYEDLLANLPAVMPKRPRYYNKIGLQKGARDIAVYVKVTLKNGGSKEIKLGSLKSWTWEQLEQRRTELQGRADRGEPLSDAVPVTFAAHSADWLARKKNTAKGYDTLRGHVEKHLAATFGRKALGEITTGEVSRWIATQRATLKPATVQRQLSTFNAILNDAVRCGLLDKNPTKNADPIKGIESRQRALSMPELHTVLSAVDRLEKVSASRQGKYPRQKAGWLRQFVLWAVHSGMRRQEILNLRQSNVKVVSDDLTVIEVVKTKSAQPRKVTATPDMKVILKMLAKLPREADDDRLFPVSLTTAKRTLTKLWKETGLDDVRLHDLRRTHVTVLVNQGVDLKTVAGRIGHANLAMIDRHYAVFLGDQKAADATQNAFSELS